MKFTLTDDSGKHILSCETTCEHNYPDRIQFLTVCITNLKCLQLEYLRQIHKQTINSIKKNKSSQDDPFLEYEICLQNLLIGNDESNDTVDG